jgi:hypothetical protein
VRGREGMLMDEMCEKMMRVVIFFFLGQDFDAKKAEGIVATFVDTKSGFDSKTWVCYGSS